MVEGVISGKTFERPGHAVRIDYVQPDDMFAVIGLNRLGGRMGTAGNSRCSQGRKGQSDRPEITHRHGFDLSGASDPRFRLHCTYRTQPDFRSHERRADPAAHSSAGRTGLAAPRSGSLTVMNGDPKTLESDKRIWWPRRRKPGRLMFKHEPQCVPPHRQINWTYRAEVCSLGCSQHLRGLSVSYGFLSTIRWLYWKGMKAYGEHY